MNAKPVSPAPSPAPTPASAPAWAPAPPSADMLAQVADALAWPLIVLRHDTTLLHANLAGRDALRAGQPLQIQAQRRVGPAAARRRTEFTAAFEAVRADGHPRLLRWPGAHGGISVALSRLPAVGTNEPTLLVALSPLDARAGSVQAFAALCGLTEAETRVLARLQLGENSTRAAAALGVAPATVRSQTVSLRRKTGHASVAELLRALAVTPPLAPVSAQGD